MIGAPPPGRLPSTVMVAGGQSIEAGTPRVSGRPHPEVVSSLGVRLRSLKRLGPRLLVRHFHPLHV